MKKRVLSLLLVLCLVAMPVAVTVSTQKAEATQKMIADFREGRTVLSRNTIAYTARSFKKGDKLHVVATSTCAFIIGINYLKTSENWGVPCIGECNRYITIPYTGTYRVFLYNKGAKRGTVKGGVYQVL